MATFVSDTFTDSDRELSTHTGETGATWTMHPDSATTLEIFNNRMTGNLGIAYYYASGTPASANYSVTGTLVSIDNSAGYSALGGRMNTTTSDYYEARLLATGVELRKIVSGTATSLGTDSFTPTITQNYIIVLEMVGTAIKVYRDTVNTISVTDSAHSAAGKAGVKQSGEQYRVDVFSATDAAVVSSLVYNRQPLAHLRAR